MKIGRLIENTIISVINAAFWLGLCLLVAGLFKLPEDVTKIAASILFGLGFISGFTILSVMQSIPDEPD